MHPRFQTAFAQLADNLQSALEPILADKYFPALLTGEQVSSLKSATGLDEDALAFALLPLAAACARTQGAAFKQSPASHTVSSCRRAAFTPGGALGAAADRRAESAG